LQRGRGELPARPDTELNSRLAFPSVRVKTWREAAEQAGIDFEEWILSELDRAASEILLPG
jgi:hypothetical protein